MSRSSSKVRFDFGSLGVHQFELPKTTTKLGPVHFFGVKKGGSTLLARIVRDVAPMSELTLWEPPKEFFSSGLPMYRCVRDVDGALARPGLAVGTFRWLPENWLMDLHDDVPCRALLLVRDPRDMLVSLYYSDKESHTLPPSGPLLGSISSDRDRIESDEMSVDEYVLCKAPQFLRNYVRTLQLMSIDDLKLIRYEDVVYDKNTLVRAVAERLDVVLSDEDVERLGAKHDIRPDGERPTEHIRQVHPGNHRDKLSPETVRRLDETFGVVIDMLRYERVHEATLV